MEIPYSDKIVSLHLERCGSSKCPHQSICYLRNRKDEGRYIKDFNVKYFLDKGYRVFDALCNSVSSEYEELLKHPNYNVSLPYHLFMNNRDIFTGHQNQVQITVYEERQLRELENWQKLFLVKDDDTFKFFESHWNIPWKNIHYVIYQEFIDEKKLGTMAMDVMLSNSYNVTLDSCFTSVAKTKTCTYHENYIDVNFDGTVRKCPFAKEGMFLGTHPEDIEKAFNIPLIRDCIYQRLLGEKHEG